MPPAAGLKPSFLAWPVDRPHPQDCPVCCRRYRSTPSGLRSGPPGGGHLWAHRPQPKRPVWTRFRVLRSPDSRRDHTRHATPEAGLMTILPEHVLQAADELLAAADELPAEDKTP